MRYFKIQVCNWNGQVRDISYYCEKNHKMYMEVHGKWCLMLDVSSDVKNFIDSSQEVNRLEAAMRGLEQLRFDT